MRLLSVLIILSCIAPSFAFADVIVSDDAIVVQGRRSDNQDRVNEINRGIRKQDVQIYANGSGQAFMMKNGKLTQLSDGEYQLPNGQKVNIKNGKLDAKFGNGQVNDNIKILPRN